MDKFCYIFVLCRKGQRALPGNFFSLLFRVPLLQLAINQILMCHGTKLWPLCLYLLMYFFSFQKTGSYGTMFLIYNLPTTLCLIFITARFAFLIVRRVRQMWSVSSTESAVSQSCIHLCFPPFTASTEVCNFCMCLRLAGVFRSFPVQLSTARQ